MTHVKRRQRLFASTCMFVSLAEKCSEQETDKPGSNRRALSILIGLIFFFFPFLSKERKRLSKLAQNSLVNGPLEVSCNNLFFLH